jgi:hypothetical protein
MMWSLAQWLTQLSKDHHLPHGYAARKGIKSLIPPQSGHVSIAILKDYVFSQDSTLASPGPSTGQSPVVQTSMYVRADGTGNWYFSAQTTALTDREWQYAAGFIFVYSTDPTVAHGYIKTGPSGSSKLDTFTAGGKDPWIAEHWPELFGPGCYFYVSDAVLGFFDVGNHLPNTNNIAFDHGFRALEQLTTLSVDLAPGGSDTISGGPPTDWVEEVGASGSSGQGSFAGGTGSSSPGDDDDDDDDNGSSSGSSSSGGGGGG